MSNGIHPGGPRVGIVRRTLRALNQGAKSVLPPAAYVFAMRWLYPLLDPARRGSRARIQREGPLWKVSRGEWTFFFNSPYKIGRYLFADTEADIFHHLLRKYSLDEWDIGPRAGGVVIDIGANVGEFTYAAAATAGKVLALEPDPSAHECLIRNAARLPNVVCDRVAAGARAGEATFYLSPDSNDSSLIEPRRYSSKVMVKVEPLADILRRHGIDRVDLLKVEAEGFEPEILEGAQPALPRVHQVVVDASPERRGQSTDADCIRILRAAGFETRQREWMVFARRPGARAQD